MTLELRSQLNQLSIESMVRIRCTTRPLTAARLWVADLTYVSTWAGFAYVAFVTDAYARRILGWRVASTMATSMVLDAIEQAIWTRQQEGVLDLKDVICPHRGQRADAFRRDADAGPPGRLPGPAVRVTSPAARTAVNVRMPSGVMRMPDRPGVSRVRRSG